MVNSPSSEQEIQTKVSFSSLDARFRLILYIICASIQPVPKYKNSGRFRIPGLCDKPDVLKTGMSATSSTRVITFLPTPLFSDPKSEVEVKTIRQYPSPQSSPFSQKYLGFDEDIDTGHDGYSSPPTSEPIQPDCDVDLHWDTHHTRERYTKVPEMIEEV